jgi:hypothetical protein
MRFAEYSKTFVIDLDADPEFVPGGFEVIEHRRGGLVTWNPHKPKIELYITPDQRKGIVPGGKVLEELEKFEGTMVNANLLDYLANSVATKPWIIPDDWKNVEQSRTKHILFWGTRYKFESGICVRTLDWSADAREQVWKPGYCWIDNLLNSQFPAAMIRKPAPATEG